jgi:hypothetical protein
MTKRYLVSCNGFCLCDAETEETITYNKIEAEGALRHLNSQGLNAQIIEIQYKDNNNI